MLDPLRYSSMSLQIGYAQCRPHAYKDKGGEWQKNEERMQGPFIVSFASEDIDNLLFNRQQLRIDETMLKDPPAKGDDAFEMYKSHGASWCAWKSLAKLDGLQQYFSWGGGFYLCLFILLIILGGCTQI